MLYRQDWSGLKKLMALKAAAGEKLTEYTSTGNPVSFETNVAKPLTGFTIPFSPVQAGSGDPSPTNVRAISGWTGVNATRCGKNLFDIETVTYGKWTSSGGTVSDASYGCMSALYPVSANDIIRFTNYGSTYSKSIILYNSDKTFNARIHQSGNDPIEYTSQIDGYFRIQIAGGSFGTIDSTYLQNAQIVLTINLTPTQYEPYSGTTIPVTFPAMGKNLFDINELWDNGTTVTSALENFLRYKIELPNGNYTISTNVINNTSSSIASVLASKSSSAPTSGNDGVFLNTPRTINVDDGSLYVFVRTVSSKYLTWDKTSFAPYYIQVESGSSATTYEPYTNTAYGGELDLLTGVLTVTWGYIEGKELTQFKQSNGFIAYRKSSPLSAKNASCGISNIINSFGSFSSSSMDKNIIQLPTGSSGIFVALDENVDVRDLKIAYELATPLTYQLTPQQISTLLGQNTIWTDTNGTNTIKYLKKG